MKEQWKYLNQIKENEANSNVYFYLARNLQEKESIVLHDGIEVTKKDLYLRAIKHSKGYNALGNSISDNEIIFFPDGVPSHKLPTPLWLKTRGVKENTYCCITTALITDKTPKNSLWISEVDGVLKVTLYDCHFS